MIIDMATQRDDYERKLKEKDKEIDELKNRIGELEREINQLKLLNESSGSEAGEIERRLLEALSTIEDKTREIIELQ
jgi:CII-binding regulator of phage lambda lysogenization HflD